MTTDVDFYVDLALRSNGPLVKLAVGNGRVAVPVAQATGRRVTGIDTSAGMLDQARVRAVEAGVDLDLRQMDMKDLALDGPAALIYCPFRALLDLPTWADRRRTFDPVAASLNSQGRFVWNAFAFDHRVAARYDNNRLDEPIPHTVHYSVGGNRIDIRLSTTARKAACGGQRRTSGSVFWTWPVLGSRRSTQGSVVNHLPTTTPKTYSSLAGESTHHHRSFRMGETLRGSRPCGLAS